MVQWMRGIVIVASNNHSFRRNEVKELFRRELIEKISSGELSPGESLVSEKGFSEMTGLSLRAVQDVLKNLVEEGWIVREPRRGTFVADRDALPDPGAVPGAPVSGKRAVMLQGVLWEQTAVRDVPGPFRRDVIHRTEMHLVQQGIEVVYSPTVFDQVEPFLRANAATVGVVIVPVLSELYKIVQKFEIPCVGIVNMPDGDMGVPFDGVGTENEQAAYDATRHLIELGHTHICHLGYLPDSSTAERYAGFRRAMDEAGLAMDDSLVDVPNYNLDYHVVWTLQAGYERMLRILAKRPDVTAMFAANDALALGAMRAALECGRSIPKDFSVVGFDDRDIAKHSIPPLTTAHIDMSRLARLAADMVIDRFENPGRPGRIERIDAPLVIRNSTSRPRHLTEATRMAIDK
jgi:DNA-binding LacI/PurR family transcriptional regulator